MVLQNQRKNISANQLTSNCCKNEEGNWYLVTTFCLDFMLENIEVEVKVGNGEKKN